MKKHSSFGPSRPSVVGPSAHAAHGSFHSPFAFEARSASLFALGETRRRSAPPSTVPSSPIEEGPKESS
ncbi:uncharacterized protein HHUB_2957 [Halobacterium hubeiense]|uniref:Uncharacterized protein n=1 Tax=Halobacterium hubeiense TaxID=1407499 RepID=A0A0U5H440_9EURY|nr:uncharacterized protein HHUB_2957 [Halobacterium hubeiense]